MRPTFARTRSPSTDGNPSRSSATTATETSPLRKTTARAVSSPRFSAGRLRRPHPAGDGQERVRRDHADRGPGLDSRDGRRDDGDQDREHQQAGVTSEHFATLLNVGVAIPGVRRTAYSRSPQPTSDEHGRRPRTIRCDLASGWLRSELVIGHDRNRRSRSHLDGKLGGAPPSDKVRVRAIKPSETSETTSWTFRGTASACVGERRIRRFGKGLLPSGGIESRTRSDGPIGFRFPRNCRT